MTNCLVFLLYALTYLFPSDEFEMVKHVQIQGDNYTTDRLGNVYIVKGYELLKYNSSGIFMYSYDNNFLGEISSVDVTNPLRIILFYKEFNQLIFLDNTLSEIGDPVVFDELGFDQVGLVCSSGRENFWVFDNTLHQLNLFNNNLQLVQKSVNLNSLVSAGMDPYFMIEENNFLYIYFPNYGIIMFDAYGTYYKTIGINDIKIFQVRMGSLYFLKEKKFLEYNYELLHENIIELPDNIDVIVVRKELNKLFLFKQEGFYIYKLLNK